MRRKPKKDKNTMGLYMEGDATPVEKLPLTPEEDERRERHMTEFMDEVKSRVGHNLSFIPNPLSSEQIAEAKEANWKERRKSCTFMKPHESPALNFSRNGNEYKISIDIKDSRLPPKEKQALLDGMIEEFRKIDPDNVHQIGMRKVGNTVTIKNPPKEIRKILDEKVRTNVASR